VARYARRIDMDKTSWFEFLIDCFFVANRNITIYNIEYGNEPQKR
jgi:hypothetical protein